MTEELSIVSVFMTMLFLGFSCSFGCGSVASSFVLGSQIGGEDCSVKSCMNAVTMFSLGKVVSLAIMGFLSSIFGTFVLDFIESVYPNSTIWIVRGFTCLFGVGIVVAALKKEIFLAKNKGKTSSTLENSLEDKETVSVVSETSGCPSAGCCPSSAVKAEPEVSGCGGCPSSKVEPTQVESLCSSSCSSCSSSCGSKKEKTDKLLQQGSYFWAGLLYATIPCGPLISTLTYASMMNPILSTLLLASFGVVNSIVPIYLHARIIGMANTELTRDTPFLMRPLKFMGGGLLIYVGLFAVQ